MDRGWSNDLVDHYVSLSHNSIRKGHHTMTFTRSTALHATILTSAALLGSLLLSGCGAASQAEPAPKHVQQSEEAQVPPHQPELPGEEMLYGVKMPVLTDDMSPEQREQLELQRLRSLAGASDARLKVKKRLDYIFKIADPTTAISSVAAQTSAEFESRALDMAFKTVEGLCLSERLDERAAAEYRESIRASAEMRFERDWPEQDMVMESKIYWLHRGIDDVSGDHNEMLKHTDALYRKIEETGCLVVTGDAYFIAPEMIEGWDE